MVKFTLLTHRIYSFVIVFTVSNEKLLLVVDKCFLNSFDSCFTTSTICFKLPIALAVSLTIRSLYVSVKFIAAVDFTILYILLLLNKKVC